LYVVTKATINGKEVQELETHVKECPLLEYEYNVALREATKGATVGGDCSCDSSPSSSGGEESESSTDDDESEQLGGYSDGDSIFGSD
jgi:hypothetical protein